MTFGVNLFSNNLPVMAGKKSKRSKKTAKKPPNITREVWLRENDPDSPFRLIDLPPELRVRVCGYYFQALNEEKKTALSDSLSCMLLPDICDVSKLVRQEFISYAFQCFKITIPVGADWAGKVRNRKSNIFPRLQTRDAGQILLSRRTESILRAAGPETWFKHVTFEIYDMNARAIVSVWSAVST